MMTLQFHLSIDILFNYYSCFVDFLIRSHDEINGILLKKGKSVFEYS